jgi:hypothetical protein
MSKARGKGGSKKTSYQADLRKALGKGPADARIQAIQRLLGGISRETKVFEGVIAIVRDASAPVDVRLAAVQALQAASFGVVRFKARRAPYLAALRAVAKDPDPQLRQRVLGVLSREKDGHAQKLLLDGLTTHEKELVPPEKALQFLSHDIHADAYRIARQIVDQPPNPAAKVEALRLLSADASSVPLFERILRDKNEANDARLVSAAALHALAPQKLQSHARAIVLDESESDELKSSSLTALAHFGNEALRQDQELKQQVDQLKSKTSSTAVQKSASQFQSKYRA